MKTLLPVLFYICIFVYSNAYAEDAVIHQYSVTGRQIKSTGAIESYNRDELKLRTSSGNVITINTDDILEIIADRPESYGEAELRMKNQEFEKALSLFQQAYVQVPDGWMKQEIRSQQIKCLYNLNRLNEAVVMYYQLIQLDPNTAFYDCVPLVWTSVELSPGTQKNALTLIHQQKKPYVALLGASLLLTSDKKTEAQTALTILTKSDDADIVTLAQMQLNRLSLTALPATTLHTMEKTLDAIPKSLQFGPRFILAQLWSRSSADAIKTDKTALNYLQCAANSNAPVELQSRSLYSAGAVLLTAERRDEAFRIFRRLIEKFPDSQWAQQAKRTAEGNL